MLQCVNELLAGIDFVHKRDGAPEFQPRLDLPATMQIPWASCYPQFGRLRRDNRCVSVCVRVCVCVCVCLLRREFFVFVLMRGMCVVAFDVVCVCVGFFLFSRPLLGAPDMLQPN